MSLVITHIICTVPHSGFSHALKLLLINVFGSVLGVVQVVPMFLRVFSLCFHRIRNVSGKFHILIMWCKNKTS